MAEKSWVTTVLPFMASKYRAANFKKLFDLLANDFKKTDDAKKLESIIHNIYVKENIQNRPDPAFINLYQEHVDQFPPLAELNCSNLTPYGCSDYSQYYHSNVIKVGITNTVVLAHQPILYEPSKVSSKNKYDAYANFYIMSYFHDAKTIVSLFPQTKADEKYYPEKPGEEVSFNTQKRLVVVKCVDLKKEMDGRIEIRKLKYSNETFRHILYTAWPDVAQIPENLMMDLIYIMELVESENVVVYQCEDGAGRSGCPAVIQHAYHLFGQKSNVSLKSVIDYISNRRVGVIPNEAQFGFCAMAILEMLNKKKPMKPSDLETFNAMKKVYNAKK